MGKVKRKEALWGVTAECQDAIWWEWLESGQKWRWTAGTAFPNLQTWVEGKWAPVVLVKTLREGALFAAGWGAGVNYTLRTMEGKAEQKPPTPDAGPDEEA